jgi:flagellar basal-body rod protein FlgF
MSELLAVVLASMQSDMARLDRVAMNLANVQTPGYKREQMLTLPFAARVQAATTTDVAALGSPAQPLLPPSSHIDQRAGTLQPTGQPLDLALTGPGWFEVATAHGPAYTRQGNFRLDPGGRLVTQQGQPVMGIGGEIQLLQATPVIDAAGRVLESPARGGTAPLGQLKIVQFDPQAALERLGDGLVRVRGETTLQADAATEVRQGFLENSNVNPMQEMMQLLQSVRHMETLQKVALGYDEMLGASIRKLGEGA